MRINYKLVLPLILLLVIHFEFVNYWILPLTWIEQPNCEPPHCQKLLLIADPQIIGPESKFSSLIDMIAIYDSDRYLKKTFLSAYNYIQPDIILFLGDLMDQGYMASDREFHSYVERLKNIYSMPSQVNQSKIIISPGDNDIGGIEEVLIPANVKRFEKIFNLSEDSIVADSIEFCKVNLMTSTLQSSKFIDGKKIRVALSHIPLISKQNYFLKEVIKKIKPHLIFSGHSHKSYHYTTFENDIWTNKHSIISPNQNEIKIYKFHEGLIHEIVVATCSYRMGVSNMGFGVAFIDTKEKLVYYSVLWLPYRFYKLFIYLSIIVTIGLLLLLRLFKRLRKHYQVKNFNNITKLYASMT